MSIIRVCCLLIDHQGNAIAEPFIVDVPSNTYVQDLKAKIKEMNVRTLANVDAHTLNVWKLLDPPTFDESLQRDITQHENETLTRRIYNHEAISAHGDWPANKLHLIVQLPNLSHVVKRPPSLSNNLEETKRRKVVPETPKRNNSDDATLIIERWRSKHIKGGLPTIPELASLADHALSEDEKIPIAANRFDGLVSSIDLRDACTSDDLRLLFKVGPGNTPLDELFFTVQKPPPHNGFESSFVSFWDRNVRDVLELLVPAGRSTRNSNLHTATGSLRPDYAFLLENICPFRGEEKGTDNPKDPKEELANKLVWVYHPAPYVLGYYAIGPRLTLVAISPPPQGQNISVLVHDIVSADLRFKKDRIKNIRRLINIAGLIESLADLVHPPDAEFEILEREHGTVEIAGNHVIRSYTGQDKAKRTQRLNSVYKVLQNKQVPHVDSIIRHYDTTFVLSPRGIAKPPVSEEDLLSAIICVLEALEVLHEEPSIIHRDIRWPNIMRRLDDPLKWFIIDWDDAAMLLDPTTAQHHLKQSTHSPSVFVDGHGTEVDVWGVGELIIRCEVLDISSELRGLGKWMKAVAPSARDALVKIKEYRLTVL